MKVEFVDPAQPSRRAWLLVLGLAAVGSLLFAAGRLLNAYADGVADDARARRLAATPVVAVVARRPAPAYQADALQALDRAALPEAPALGELEAVAVAGVSLRSIDVDMARHSVIVELQSTGQAALDDYLDQLNAGRDTPAWRIARLASADGASSSRGPAAPAAVGGQLLTIERAF